jgi:hypothetical protein
LKKHLGGRRFATDAEVQQAVMSWLQALDTDFCYAGIDALVYRWDKCFGKYGDYVEKIICTKAVLLIIRVYII